MVDAGQIVGHQPSTINHQPLTIDHNASERSEMSFSQIDLMAAGTAVIGVWMCGVTRVHHLLWALTLQTGILAAIAGVHALGPGASQYLLLAGVVVAIKALAIPSFLGWTADRIDIRRDNGTVLSPTLALLVAV